ncbi:unnamed protein product [Arabidopsis halleri]
MCLYDPLAVTKFYGIVLISEMRMAESTRIRANPNKVPVCFLNFPFTMLVYVSN